MTTGCSIRRTGIGLAVPLSILAFPQTGLAAEETLSERVREEIIVTATRLPSRRADTGSTLNVFDAQDFENRERDLASEILREVPGVAVNRSGPVGSLTQVRIRGAESNHTLVLIDGIEVNDPAFGSEFNFADLLLYGIDRMEVLRGPQSALYGSDAIGGVVSVESLVPAERGFSAGLDAQTGTHATRQLGGTLAGRGETMYGSLSAVRYETDGISASAIEPERDGYETTSLHGRVTLDLTDRLSVSAIARHADNEVDTDPQDFEFPATPTQGLVVDGDGHAESSQLYGMLEISLDATENWQHRLRYGYTDTETDFFQDGGLSSGSEGRRETWEYLTSYQYAAAQSHHSLTAGVQRETLDFTNIFPLVPDANYSEQDDQTSYVAEYGVTFDRGLALSFSLRHDNNDRFDDATTARATASYLLSTGGTRLHASVGQGVTNPTFTELFGFTPSSFIGNPNLEPEKSVGWDAGVEQALWAGRVLVDVTYFQADLDDEIATVFDFSTFTSTAENLGGESEREGVELSVQAELGAGWLFAGSYGYLDATDPSGIQEVRRPRHTASANLHGTFAGGRGGLDIGVVYNGSQADSEFVLATPQSRVTLDAFTLLNLVVSYEFSPRWRVFIRGDNVLDEDYSEVFGYRSLGRTGSVGVRLRL